jgi:hypothetical protein
MKQSHTGGVRQFLAYYPKSTSTAPFDGDSQCPPSVEGSTQKLVNTPAVGGRHMNQSHRFGREDGAGAADGLDLRAG